MELTQQRLDEIFVAHKNANFDLLLELSQKLQQDFPNLALSYKATGIALLAKIVKMTQFWQCGKP